MTDSVDTPPRAAPTAYLLPSLSPPGMRQHMLSQHLPPPEAHAAAGREGGGMVVCLFRQRTKWTYAWLESHWTYSKQC